MLKRFFQAFNPPDISPDFFPDVKPEYQGLTIAAIRMDDCTFPVILTCNTPYAYLGAASYVGRELADRPALFLVYFTWSQRKPKAVHLLARARMKWHDSN
jgi:hypothetical protein